ncbi:hypothetical protein D3C84_397600 [compost metagenome]
MLIAMLRRTPRSRSPPKLSRALCAACSTSERVTRPSGPLPASAASSTPICRASWRTAGVARGAMCSRVEGAAPTKKLSAWALPPPSRRPTTVPASASSPS